MNIDVAKEKLRTYFDEACKVLNVNHETIDFAYEGIGERFKTNDVTCETAENILYINLKWLEMLPDNDNGDYDLRHQMYHEARHFYQHNAIADYHTRGKTTELPSTIKKWEFESSNYKPNEGTEEERKAYAVQDVEIDANAFAIAMLHANGIDKARIPAELMVETSKRAQEIYSRLERLGRWKKHKKVNEQ
jgi:hypothetical protein